MPEWEPGPLVQVQQLGTSLVYSTKGAIYRGFTPFAITRFLKLFLNISGAESHAIDFIWHLYQ